MNVQFTFSTILVSGGVANIPPVKLHYLESDALLSKQQPVAPLGYRNVRHQEVTTQRSARSLSATVSNVPNNERCIFSLRDSNDLPFWRSKSYIKHSVPQDINIQLIDLNQPFLLESADLRSIIGKELPLVKPIPDSAGFRYIRINRLKRIQFLANQQLSITLDTFIMKKKDSFHAFYMVGSMGQNVFEPITLTVRAQLSPSKGLQRTNCIDIELISVKFDFINPTIQTAFDASNGTDKAKKELNKILQNQINEQLAEMLQPLIKAVLPNANPKKVSICVVDIATQTSIVRSVKKHRLAISYVTGVG